MQNCFVKSAISGVMGFGMGGLFGLFMASVRLNTPVFFLQPPRHFALLTLLHF